jgi:Uma2 family endonuclease
MAVEPKRRKFTTDEYEWMGRVGILREDDRVELIDGEVVEMAPIGPGHASRVKRSAAKLHKRFGDVAVVSVQDPIVVSRHNEPEPDLALLRPRVDFYELAHPTASDVLLVVEVADSTLAYDRGVKTGIYAAAVIPETWVLNVPDGVLHVYREPVEGEYRVVQTFRRGEKVAPLAFPDREIDVAELLG